MGVYRKILVPLDCSEVDEAIVCHVAALAKSEGATVVLAHVVHSHTLDQDRALKERALACTRRHEAELKAMGVPTETLLLSGEPEVELVQAINAGDYDLIAMATHGHRFFLDLLLGSVSDHLKHKVSVPLLLVRGTACPDA
jgi:universal stress protein A